MTTNNVTRFLESKKIEFTAIELPEEKIGALETASILNVDPYIVYKSIVVVREKSGKPILAIIPGPYVVDLKKLADVVEEKKLKIPTLQAAEKMTGLQAGGISPLALLNKGFQFIIDAKSLEQPFIQISGGQRGLNIRIKTSDLVKLINARIAPISSPSKKLESDK